MTNSDQQALSPYERLGGDAGVRRLVDRFYQIMDEAPEAWELRQIHPPELQGSADKLYKFLSGWLGGPSLYIEEYGHPMLRRRHLPFKIGTQERDQWMMCMNQALDEMQIDNLMRMQLKAELHKVADHMRNQPG